MSRVSFVRSALFCCFLVGLNELSVAADKAAKRSDKKPVPEETVTAVDFFTAEKDGDIKVKVIPKDATGGSILVTNKTDKPLTIKLPDAFVGVPVAAQFGGMGGMGGMGGGMNGGMGGMGGGMGGGMNQAMGGGMGMGGMGGGMGGMGGGMGGMGGGMGGMGGGGFFRVEPAKVGKLKMVTVCLEHGKKDPNAHIEYKLMPADSYTKNSDTLEALKMLGRGEVDQRSAQAAVWNTENDMDWKSLANKIGVKHLNGSTEPFFEAAHIARGMQIVQEAQRRGEQSKSSSESTAKQSQ
jgi:hypothetical protein